MKANGGSPAPTAPAPLVGAARPLFSSTETTLELPKKSLEFVPFKFRANNLQTLDLRQNMVRALPKKTMKLVTLNLSMNKLEVFPPKMEKRLGSYKRLKTLDLSHNKLATYPRCLVGSKRLQKLILADNKIPSFDSRLTWLKELDLNQNLLEHFPDIPAGIEILRMNFNRLTSLNTASDRIQRLSLSMNAIVIIGPEFNMPSLLELDISRNRIAELPNMAVVAPSLVVCDCSDNFLKEFPHFGKEILQCSVRANHIVTVPSLAEMTPALRELDLSHNLIKVLPKLPASLQRVVTSDNELEGAEERSSLPLLEMMSFDSCELVEMVQFSEHKMTEIRYPFNRIKELDLKAIARCVKRIELRGNQITEVPKELFTEFPALLELSLARNKILQIPEEWASCQSLKTVNLSHNELRLGLPDKFPPNLVYLSVSYCRLREICSGISECKDFNELVATGNMLQELPDLPTCKNLYLSRNWLTRFPTNICDDILRIDLSFNFIMDMPLEMRYKCLLDLDLSHNNICSLPKVMAMPALLYLKLSHNHELENLTQMEGASKLIILNVEGTRIRVPKVPPVREFMTDQDELFTSHFVKVMWRNKGIGYAEMCGSRDGMEDAIVVRANVKDDVSLYAVFDGHAGAKTATVASHVYTKFALANAECTKEFMLKSIQYTIACVKKAALGDGATAISVVRQGNRIVTGHLGDSRAIIVRKDGYVRFETEDHKPGLRSEFEYVRDVGGRIEKGRTHSVLAMTRSIGDFWVVGLNYEPEINEVELEPADKWLVVACDGVWDVIMPDIMCDMCCQARDAPSLAADIRNMSYALQSQDNISVMVIDLEFTA